MKVPTIRHPSVQRESREPTLVPFRRPLDKAPRLRDLPKNFRQAVEADIMPLLVVRTAAPPDRRAEGFAACRIQKSLPDCTVFRIVRRPVAHTGGRRSPSRNPRRNSGSRCDAFSRSSKRMKDVGLHHARPAVPPLPGSVPGSYVPARCTWQISILCSRTNSVRSEGGGRLESRLVPVRRRAHLRPSVRRRIPQSGTCPNTDRKSEGFSRFHRLESVRHVEHADLRRHMRSYLMTKNIIGFASPR